MNISLNIINSFSIDGAGGNPAGVVLGADTLTTSQKQQIARKAGLSETAFVSRSAIADFKLEFFTPTKQIPHCGHATIAAFWYLKSLGKIHSTTSSKETIDGTRKIFFLDDEPYMEQLSPKFTPIPDSAEILSSVGLTKADLHKSLPPVIGNTGNSFVLIGVDQETKLKLIKPDFQKIARITTTLNCVGYYVFAITDSEFNAQARMFAPAFGINEESATGMAAGPLASLLFNSTGAWQDTLIIGQGKYMSDPSPSKINVHVELEGDIIKSLTAGGKAYLSKTKSIEI